MKRILFTIVLCLFLVLTSSILIHSFAFADDASLKLQVPLQTIGTELKLCSGSGDSMTCDGIARYLTAVFEWLIRFAIVAGALTLSLAGYAWMTARGSSQQTEKAKAMIKNTLWGVLLALGSYTLLWAVNPDLVSFGSLDLQSAKKMDLIFQPIEIEELPVEEALEPPGCGTPLSTQGSEVMDLISQGKIKLRCVGSGTCAGQTSGRWNEGLQGRGAMPIDPKILGAIAFVAKTCGFVQVHGLNESSGHSGASQHYQGRAVDIGGDVCGAGPNTCTQRQRDLISALKNLGYRVGTPAGSCGGSFRDAPGHFHIDLGLNTPAAQAQLAQKCSPSPAPPSGAPPAACGKGTSEYKGTLSANGTWTQQNNIDIWVPSAFQNGDKADVLYYFHGILGTGGSCSGTSDTRATMLNNGAAFTVVQTLIANGSIKPIVLVVPHDGSDGKTNRLVQAQSTAQSVLTSKGISVASESIAGHSNGGVPLAANWDAGSWKYIGMIDPAATGISDAMINGKKDHVIYSYRVANWTGSSAWYVAQKKRLQEIGTALGQTESSSQHCPMVAEHMQSLTKCFAP